VPTALDAMIPSSNIDNLPSEFPQDDGSFLDPALPSHGEFALLDHERESAAATTNSAPTSERMPSKPLLFDHVEPSIRHDQFIEFLNCLEDKQETLRDAREALLGSRSRLQVQRRDLTATRAKAASQAGAAFNRLRQYLVEIGINPPVDIQAALSEAEASRNALGTEEVDYDEAEKAYNFEEWRYTTKESQFIDDMYGSGPTPNQPDKPYSPLDKHGESARISFGPQDIANMVAESEGGLYCPMYSPRMSPENEGDLSESEGTIPGDRYHPISNYSTQENLAAKNSNIYPAKELLFEELAIGHSRLNWAGIRRYINEWLLESLDTSRLERRRLKHHSMTEIDLSDEEWWELVGQLWFSDTPEGVYFHTGNTTASEESRSEPYSSNAMHRLFGTSDTAEPETQQFPPTPHLGRDHVMDALELANFPADIEPLDLVDIAPKDLTFLERSFSAHSESTRLTTLTRASSRLDCSSHSTTEENWFSIVRPEYDITQPRGIPSIKFSTGESQHYRKPEASFAHSISPGGSAYGRSPTSTTTPQPRLDFHDLHSHQRTTSPQTCIEEPSAQKFTANSTGTGTILDKDKSNLSEVEWLSPRPRKQNLEIYEPYIGIESPDPWNLPIYD
jgi:hypothetical protein